MPIKIRKDEQVTIVQIEGRLDTATYSAFEAEVAAVLGNGSSLFVFDCAELVYASSAGLRAMLALRKKLHASSIPLRLCRLQPSVHQVFELSGFTDIFDIRDTLEASLK